MKLNEKLKGIGGILVIYGIGLIMLASELLGFDKNYVYTIILFIFPTIILIFNIKYSIKINNTDLLIYLYLIYIIIYIFLDIDYYAKERLKLFGYMFFMVFVPYLMGKNYTIESLKLFKFISYLIFIFYSISIFSIYIWPNWELAYRPVFFSDDSFTARLSEMYSVVSIFLLSSILYEKTKIKIILKIILLILTYIVILQLGLKVIFISLTIALIIIMNRKYHDKKIKYGKIYILCLIITFTLSIMVIADYQYFIMLKSSVGFINDILSNEFNIITQYNKCINIDLNNSIAIRSVLFTDAIGNIIRYPVFGSGPWTFEQFSCWSGVGSHPHNILLQSLSELGIIGTIPLILIIYEGIKKIIVKKIYQQSDIIIIGIFTLYIINVQFNGDIYTNSGLFFSIGLLNSRVFLMR